ARGHRPRAAVAAGDPAVRRAAFRARRGPPRRADPVAAAGARRSAPADAVRQPPPRRGAAAGGGGAPPRLGPFGARLRVRRLEVDRYAHPALDRPSVLLRWAEPPAP